MKDEVGLGWFDPFILGSGIIRIHWKIQLTGEKIELGNKRERASQETTPSRLIPIIRDPKTQKMPSRERKERSCRVLAWCHVVDHPPYYTQKVQSQSAGRFLIHTIRFLNSDLNTLVLEGWINMLNPSSPSRQIQFFSQHTHHALKCTHRDISCVNSATLGHGKMTWETGMKSNHKTVTISSSKDASLLRSQASPKSNTTVL